MTKNQPVPITTKKHNGIISFWKFCFCVMIIFFHGRIFAGEGETAILPRGSIGVEFFFIVSGFLLAKSTFKRNSQEIGETHEHLGKETFGFIIKKYLFFLPYVLFAGILTLSLQNIFKHISLTQNITSLWDMFIFRMTGIKGNVVAGPAWYLSAMLLSMMILYPMLRKYKHNFVYLVAPLVVLFGFGWLSHTYSNLRDPELWTGLVYKGLIRGFVELTLGCILYLVCQKLKQVHFTKLGKILITIIEISGFLVTFAISQFVSSTKFDFIVVVALAISILLAFTEETLEFNLCNNKLFFWLEKFSLPLYLCNTVARDFIDYSGWFTSMSYYPKLAIYLVITFVLSIICMYLIPWIQKKHLGIRLKNLLLEKTI